MISLTVALQMFISAVYLRTRSQELGDAYQWVQDDFETVRRQAVAFESSALPYSSNCGAVTPANGLAARFVNSALGGSFISLGPRTLGGEEVRLNRTADLCNLYGSRSFGRAAIHIGSGGGPTAEL
ncbi:MAG: hypothetical protein HC810_04960 [Acaryochloridaceae cyanobacterium RL_2_7]|nr:hypothetical protein [Acaryochloridaceae cyanobacterium RL_2_7]